MRINLSGQTAVVTGATGQLGRVMALTLAECGANIIIHYLQNEVKATELQQEIEAMARKSLVVQADVTNPKSVMDMQRAIFDRFGHADIVVANAVSQYQWTTILEQPLHDYQSQFDMCVLQSVLLAKAFVPNMITRKGGRIIGINTECAMQNDPTQSAYVAGKRGMDGIYRILAKEIGPYNITVNQVAPGWTISARDRDNHTERNEAYESHVPLRRRGTDQEVANAVAFLASDLASFITGAVIPVSGGNVMPTI
jgi:3-oxoacyl-[acyl-carrier protein] reductase